MRIRKQHLEILRPYFVNETPSPEGEIYMHCPLHTDGKRSAGINIEKGKWNCHAGCGGGNVSELMLRRAEFSPPPSAGSSGGNTGQLKATEPAEEINEGKIKGWAAALASNTDALDELTTKRGLTYKSVKKFEIGWDSSKRKYTIPVRDVDGTILNVRRYDINAGERRKIYSVKGMGAPQLYPLSVLADDPEDIIVCEGEWDALLTIQKGFPAITRTGAADVWRSEWNEYFKGKRVYLAHDADQKGQAGNRVAAKALAKSAREIRVLHLPYDIEEKHGKDLTDYWQEGHAPVAFRKMLERSTPWDAPMRAEDAEPVDAKVLDAFNAKLVGKPLRFQATIKGKHDPGYAVPAKVHLTCDMNAGAKCNTCPLKAAGGDAEMFVPPHDPVVLEFLGSTKAQVRSAIRESYGIPKCSHLEVEVLEHHSVEVLLGRPSIDVNNGSHAGDYKSIKITSVGRHDTMPNNTVQVVGALYPDPKEHTNEFLAWDVGRLETSLDYFEPDDKTLVKLRRFQPKPGQRPLAKLAEISRDMALHVTRIYGRAEMHAAMDLVFHSALSFDFGGHRISRGWLDMLVVGDTRTGKSEVAQRLCDHYGVGEVVSCESASFAGIVGGAQQINGNRWVVTWGTVPINDRRLVVLDEVGGMTPQEIAQMSSVRSSGIAEIQKIAAERTHARTRLIWLGNPRNQRMSDYTYGVQAIRPLIGNAEDIARFDLAMSVRSDEVSINVINRQRSEGHLRYSSELCQQLIRWVWSRTPEQVRWTEAATRAVYKAAGDLAQRYIEEPPLVQGANVRLKIARIAVAIAARLFSTDKRAEKIMVRAEHVLDAVQFIDRLYSMHNFGYAELSRERVSDAAEADGRRDEMRDYLGARRDLTKFLRQNSSFRREDLEAMLNWSREEANGVINALYTARMVRKDKGDVRVEPALHTLLRDVKV